MCENCDYEVEGGYGDDGRKSKVTILYCDLHKAAPEMYDLIERFGRAVTDMFEQLLRGNWRDDHDHDVKMNAAMLALKQPVEDAITLRAGIDKVEGGVEGPGNDLCDDCGMQRGPNHEYICGRS